MAKVDNEQLDKEFILHTYKRNYVNFTHGKGSRLYDDEGRDYVDFGSGIAVCSVGHANERLAKAICEQANSLIHTSNLYFIEPQARLAKRIVELCGYAAGCFFSNSGAEANEGAIKIARKYGCAEDGSPERYKIVSLRHSFHGRTINTLKMTAQDKFHAYFGPYTEGFLYADTPQEAMQLAKQHDVIAVIVELIQGEGGVQEFSREEMQALSSELKSQNKLLIIDEIQTGVWRTGEFLASKLYGIEPDITTLAKGLGGGVPIGCVVTKLTEVLNYGDHGSTFGGNYLSTRAALEVLAILDEQVKSGALNSTIERFGKELDAIRSQFSHIFSQKTGLGLLCGLRTADDEAMTKVIDAAFDKGLVLLKAGRSTVRFAPSLTITDDEISDGFARLRDALASF